MSLPLFWQNETTGRMKKIVMKFLNQETLNEKELTILKQYLIQWIDALPSRPNHYKYIIMKATQKQLKDYLGELLAFGIDPF